MKENIKVSIIIPIYNVEKYISECLDSVCNQTLKEIEILCIDDCGKDNSINIVKEYLKKDNRIKIIRHDKNKGLSGARNTGIRNAIGEYIGFVDSDDYISLNFYENLYNLAKKENADIVQSFLKLYYDDTKLCEDYCLNKEIEKFDSRIQNIEKLDIYFNAAMVWNKIFKTDLILQNNIFFPEGLYWEDNPFTIQAAYYANKIIPEINSTYFYRQRPGSIITIGNEKSYFDMLKIHNSMIDFINSINLDKKSYNNIFNRFMSRLDLDFEKLQTNQDLKHLTKRYVKEWKKLYSKCLYKTDFKKEYKQIANKISISKLKRFYLIIINILHIIKLSLKICINIVINSYKLISLFKRKNV